MQMDPNNNTKDLGLADDALQLRRERQRVRCAEMTDKQREERNRKRREAYKRKKSYANKENDPGCDIQDFKPSHADTNIADDPTGIYGLRRESDRALSALNSDDKRLERNKKRRKAYRTKKDATQSAAISSAEHHVECISGTAPTIEHPPTDLNFQDDAAEQHVDCFSGTAPTIEHSPTGHLIIFFIMCIYILGLGMCMVRDLQ